MRKTIARRVITPALLGLLLATAGAQAASPAPGNKLSAIEQLFTCATIDKKTIKAALKAAPEIVSYEGHTFKTLNTPAMVWGQNITSASVYVNEGEQAINWRYVSTLPFETLRAKLKIPAEGCPAADMCESWVGFASKDISKTPAALLVSCQLQYHGDF